MKLAIDAREAVHPQRTGKGQWARGCIEELLQRDVQLCLYTDRPVPDSWKDAADIVSYAPGLMWHWNISRHLAKQDDVAYFSPTSFLVPSIAPSSVRCFPVVHDLIAYQSDPHDKKAKCIERLTLPRALKKASHVFTISESTSFDLQSRFSCLPLSSKMTTVYAGPFAATPPRTTSDNKTIFCPGTLCPRKNQLGLIRAYAMLPDSLRKQYILLLVGKRGWCDEEIVKLAAETQGVEWRNYVPDAEYEQLLQTCAVLAFPSLYEGFGLPVLDAMQRGIPVLTSDRGSLKEVAGDAAILVEPHVACSIKDGLERLLTNQDVQKECRKKGFIQADKFTWKQTVNTIVSRL